MVDPTEDYADDENYDPEAENFDWGQGKKLNLPEVPVLTGEEEEDTLAKYRCKLYRWVKTEWKERGVGDLRFLKHKTSKKIRVVLRQDKTHKVVANFYVSGDNLCKLTRMQSNDKAWIWTCYDCSDLPPTIQKLCGRFVSKEDFESFQKDFESAIKENSTVVQQSPVEKKPEEAKEDKPEQAATTTATAEKKE